jgi:putative salt-induced outer membrane protein YdiY
MKRITIPTRIRAQLLLLAFFLFFIVRFSSAKRKDDVVVMKNGDTFTGEIKELQYGELVFKSDYMKDSVHLDWKRVKNLISKDTYIIQLSDGRRITGAIQKIVDTAKQNNEEFKIIVEDVTVELHPEDVIVIEQRELSFWNQLTGGVSYGFSFAGGNTKSVNSSLSANVAFNTEKNSVRAATSSQYDLQTHAQSTNRFTFDAQYGRSLTTRWIAAGLFSVLKSNQQDLELRSTYGGGMGRRLVQTDRTSLLAIAGMAYSHERYVPQPGTEPIRNNAEALLGLTFSTFRFSKMDMNSQTFLFPSLSDPGRFRLSSQSILRIELIRNFDWNFQVYENYDTRPPVNAPKNDLGLTTSLGWTF